MYTGGYLDDFITFNRNVSTIYSQIFNRNSTISFSLLSFYILCYVIISIKCIVIKLLSIKAGLKHSIFDFFLVGKWALFVPSIKRINAYAKWAWQNFGSKAQA